MTALNKQALRQLATDAHELGIIKRYTKGIEANKRFVAIATPLTVLALLDELEAAQKLATQQGNIAVALLDEVTTLRRNANDNVPELRECLEAAEKRIAELEARTVTVKLPELCVGVVQDGHAVMVPYAAGHWFNKTAILEMLTAAGIGVKGE